MDTLIRWQVVKPFFFTEAIGGPGGVASQAVFEIINITVKLSGPIHGFHGGSKSQIIFPGSITVHQFGGCTILPGFFCSGFIRPSNSKLFTPHLFISQFFLFLFSFIANSPQFQVLNLMEQKTKQNLTCQCIYLLLAFTSQPVKFRMTRSPLGPTPLANPFKGLLGAGPDLT